MCKVHFDAAMFYLALTVHKMYCWAMVWKPYTKIQIVLMLMGFPHMQDL